MAKKIEVSTVRQMADVQVINVSSRLIYLALKAQMTLNRLIVEATHETTKWNDVEKKWETVVDENGEPIPKVDSISGKVALEHVMPFLNELVDALKDDELPLRFRVVLVKKHGGSLERQAFYVSSIGGLG